jgi:uncharacterized protein (DUF58 family)
VIDEPEPPPPPEPVHWTGRTYLLFGFGSLLAIAAVALRDPVPLFAALPLLLAPALATAIVPSHLARVDLAWEASGSGPEIRISGTLRGSFGVSVGEVMVELPPLPGTREIEPIRYERTPTEIRFQVAWSMAEPSIATSPPPRVLWHDPFGLTERTLEGVRPSLPLERYPPGLHRSGALQLERTIALPGESRSRSIGPSGEFFGLRPGAPGEPPRRINWRATARLGRIVANEYMLEQTGDLVVLLDVRPSELGAAFDNRLLGVARSAVYGITESLLRTRVRVGYASFGEFVEAVPLSMGRVHRVRLLQAILRTRRSEIAAPAERCALGLRRFYRPGVTILVVSSWAGDPAFDLLPYVRRQGFPVILLSPSPLPFQAGTGGFDAEDERMVERFEHLERRVRLADLWVHGPVIDWDDFWSLHSLVAALRRPAVRRVR